MEQRASKRANRAPFVVRPVNNDPARHRPHSTIHHSSLPRVKHSRFLARQIPIWSVDGIVMLIMRQISRWIVIEIPPFVAFVAYLRVNDQLSMYQVLKLWIFVFLFFFKRKEIGYDIYICCIYVIFFENTCSFYFFFYCVRQDFSLSVDRNIFQGERDGGKNLLGWRIVLGNDFLFFFETSWMKCSKDRWDGGGPLGGSTKFLIDRGRFDTLRRVDQKVVLLEIQEINERVEKLAKRVLYKLVIKTLHNYRWNYSFTFINKNETMKKRSRSR